MEVVNDPIVVKIRSESNSEDDVSDIGFQCDQCPGVYKTKKKLKQHKARIHSDKKFLCSTCGFEVVGQKNYKNHIRQHQSKVQCPLCNKDFSQRCLDKHVEKCKGPQQKKKRENKYFCERCGFGTKSQKQLDRHIKTHDKVHVRKVHECEDCGYWTHHLGHMKRHEERCVEKKKKIPPSVVTNKTLEELFSESHVSISDFNNIVKFFRDQFGDHFFETGASKVISEYCKSMNHLSTCETVEFEEKENGKKFHSTLAYMSDIKGFVSEVITGRGLKSPRMVIGADYGQNKLLVTCSFYDEEDPNAKCNGKLPSAPQSSFLLASADLVPETYLNLEKIFKKLGFPLDMPNLR